MEFFQKYKTRYFCLDSATMIETFTECSKLFFFIVNKLKRNNTCGTVRRLHTYRDHREMAINFGMGHRVWINKKAATAKKKKWNRLRFTMEFNLGDWRQSHCRFDIKIYELIFICNNKPLFKDFCSASGCVCVEADKIIILNARAQLKILLLVYNFNHYHYTYILHIRNYN